MLKQISSKIKYEYEQFSQACSYFRIKPSYSRFVREYLTDKIIDKMDSFYMFKIGPIICNYKGHLWKTKTERIGHLWKTKTERITYTHCIRCGETKIS
jgi:hypothetical protein